ncbi:MAG: hypothetical protein K6T59_00195 [Bryobacteraceae bacterium]|nr:hypothetical protein [Bryobacteraceae bacterium]
MSEPRVSASSSHRWFIPACFVLQAALLFAYPSLLPVWGDESFTLEAARQPLPDLIRSYAGDVNPPLHGLLLHYWLKLPWPLEASSAARILSGLILLLAGWAATRIWTPSEEPRARFWFVVFWSLSPSLLLFGRMARAYSLQILLFTLALAAALRLIAEPRRPRRTLSFALYLALLLYTHYLPALALLAGGLARTLWLALFRKENTPLLASLASAALALFCYAPWLAYLWRTLERLTQVTPQPAVSNPLAAEALRLGYTFFSFAFGETPPAWVFAGGLLLGPAVLWLLWKGIRPAPAWLWILFPAAVAAYLGAGRWVSFVFVPARLLFLLPFFLLLAARGAARSGQTGAAAALTMLLLCAGSVVGYYGKTVFLNKAYLIPYQQIADLIQRESAGVRTAVVADACNLDPWPLLRQLSPAVQTVLVGHEHRLEEIQRRLLAASPGIIWHIRNTRDTCPCELNNRLGAVLLEGRLHRRSLFIEYSARDKLLLRALGIRKPPSHFLQLDQYRAF